MKIEVSTGPCFDPMKIHVHVFQPSTWDITGQYQLASDDDDHVPRLVERYSAPVGILGLIRDDVKSQCREYIESMLKNPNYTEQATAGHPTAIPRRILDIARQYDAAKKVGPARYRYIRKY